MPDRQPRVALLEEMRNGGSINIAHALAMASRYHLTVVDANGHSVMRFSRETRYARVPGWSWEGHPGQLRGAFAAGADTILMPTHIQTMRWVIRHRDELSRTWRLPLLPSLETFDIARDKLALAQFAQHRGVRIPAFTACAADGAIDLAQMTFPALLKPRLGLGGKGIRKFRDACALEAHLATLAAPSDYLVQGYLDGSDLSCGVVAKQGRVIAQVQYAGLTRYSEFSPFSSIMFIEDRDVSDFVAHIAALLEWDGIAGFDLRRDESGALHLLEINPRPFGALLAAAACGVNLVDMWCRSAGEEIEPVGRSLRGRRFACGTRLGARAILGSLGGMNTDTPWNIWRNSTLPFVLRDPLPHVAQWMDRAVRRRRVGELSATPAAPLPLPLPLPGHTIAS